MMTPIVSRRKLRPLGKTISPRWTWTFLTAGDRCNETGSAMPAAPTFGSDSGGNHMRAAGDLIRAPAPQTTRSCRTLRR
jgi:hypothetical protein